jgi:nitrogen-specific signal transduction histidine kinase
VLDSGPGIDERIEGRLFEPFATTKPEGIGLGLAASRQVAQSHGGTLSYCRKDDTTCFDVALPRSSPVAPCVAPTGASVRGADAKA